MTDTLELTRARGVRAKLLMEDELLVESFQSLQDTYIKAWRTSPARDVEAREKLWSLVKLIDGLRRHLEKVAMDGKIADADLQAVIKRDEAKRLGNLYGLVA